MSDGTDDPEVRWAEGLDPALTFTREDLELLEGIPYDARENPAALHALIAKIRALLPPE